MQENDAVATKPHQTDTSLSLDLLEVFRPQIRAAHESLQLVLQELYLQKNSEPLSVEQAMELMMPDLLGQLWTLSQSTLVLELNVSRMRGELSGATPALRYKYFVGQLTKPEFANRILSEYSVLTERVESECANWIVRSSEFIQRLLKDWSVLKNVFSLPTPNQGGAHANRLSIESTLGDRHNRGRTVLILQFTSGHKLVYKPRSLAVEAQFAELVEWINARNPHFTLRPIHCVDRGDYGWVEFLPDRSCDCREAVRRYYQRQGAYLAMLYLLGATDMHFENIVAYGEHPMLIDMEALFHQRLPDAPQDLMSESLSQSVVATRLLPQAAYVPGISQAMDFSGMAAVTGTVTPFRAQQLDAVGTDEMSCQEVAAVLPEGRHLPKIGSDPVLLTDFVPEFRDGFRKTISLVIAHRDELLSSTGPLAAFANATTRFIPRPSQSYAIVLKQSQHPDCLRDSNLRDQCFERLSVRSRQFPSLQRLQSIERNDLSAGDIPLLTSCPSSTALRSSCGICIRSFFRRPALELAFERLLNLNQDECERQLWLIDAALAMSGYKVPANDMTPELSAESPLRRALLYGERLRQLAWTDGQTANWFTLVPQERGWSLGPLNGDPTMGLPKVLVALGALADASGAAELQELAELVHRQLDMETWLNSQESQSVGRCDLPILLPHQLADNILLCLDALKAGPSVDQEQLFSAVGGGCHV